MMTPLLIPFLLLLQPTTGAQTETEEVFVADAPQEPMSRDIAIARMNEALTADQPQADRIDLLSEIYARCDDATLRAASAFNLGSMMIIGDETSAETLEDGIGWLRLADKRGAEQSLRARARYNIGHARYMQAHAEPGADQMISPGDLSSMVPVLEEKIGMLHDAAGAFRSVHEIEPANSDAVENLERVRREIRQLREQLQALKDMIEQQQEQQRQQQQQQEEAAERLRELAEKQRQESEQNRSDPEQSNAQQQQDQSELNEQTEQEKDLAEDVSPTGSEQSEQIQQSLENAREAQKRAQQALEQGDTQQAAEQQQKAAEALREAAEQMQQMADSQSQQQGPEGEQGESESQSQGEAQGEQEGEPQQNDGDEISEIARMLLEKERREREARKAYRSTGRPVKVEKDW